MFHLLYLILLLGYVAYNNGKTQLGLKLDYLEELTNEEISKAWKYKARVDNSDLLGDFDKSKDIEDYGKFDFIVVGAGSSGGIVASRLSEVEKWKVLLLEAGTFNDDFSDIPFMFDVSATSDRNWGYLTVPQKNGCFGRNNKQCPLVRGKMLGGTGTINGLVWSRGIKSDFDKWAEAGNRGWSWNDVLPYYKKMENFQSETIDVKYRGFAGPVNVAYVKPAHPLHKAFVQANEEIGIPYIEDYNAEKVNGVSLMQHNLEHGRRVSSANNYIIPASLRQNFNVTVNAYATKILITNDTKTAYGIEFVKNGKIFRALASREVIVSAGAINSPQLLMLSGIGPKSELQKHGIKLIQDLPVGRNLKDHFGFLLFNLNTNFTEPTLTTRDLLSQFHNGEGLFTDPQHYNSLSYYNFKNRSSLDPNFEIDFAPSISLSFKYPQCSNYKSEITQFLNSMNKPTTLNFQLFLLHPKSSGNVTLKSANPKDFPLVDTKIFENEEDLEDMYKGIEVALKLLDTKVAKALNWTLQMNVPSCSGTKYRSKSFWYCVLRYLAIPALQLSSSTKMGPRCDPLAVVNHKLKVYGMNGLRVVDVGITPGTVTGHLNAVAFLIGEMGADLIKKDHLKAE